MHTLLIARHGNTFDKGDIIRRVGLRTDLPLSTSGEQQADKLGNYLVAHYPKIDEIYCSELCRTQQTAEIIVKQYPQQAQTTVSPISLLNEIDYGEDDGAPESEVAAKLGKKILQDWDEKAILPPGWLLDIPKVKKDIQSLINKLFSLDTPKTVLLVTSNGIARFFPCLLENKQTFHEQHKLKLPTTGLAAFTKSMATASWQCEFWGKKS